MNKIEIEKLLEETKPQVIEAIKKQILDHVTWDVKEVVADEVKKTVQLWMEEVGAPLVVNQLEEGKNSLVKAGVEMGQCLADELSKGFAKTIQEKMENGWQRKKVFEGLLG